MLDAQGVAGRQQRKIEVKIHKSILGGKTFRATDDEIMQEFSRFGKISSFRFKGRYCFVEYEDYHSA